MWQILDVVRDKYLSLNKVELAFCLKQLHKHFYQCLQHDEAVCEIYVTNLRHNPWFKVQSSLVYQRCNPTIFSESNSLAS